MVQSFSSEDIPEGSYEWYIEQARDIVDAYTSGNISGKEASGHLISLRRMVREQSVAEAKSGGFAPNVPELYYRLERLSDQIVDEMIQEDRKLR
jgi:hypothetical protein